MAKKKISIVTPCFNEEELIVECVLRIRKLFEEELDDYEHIFSDNASTDSTVQKLKDLAREDSRIKVIVNSRNFGPFRSMYNGLSRSSGDAVLTFLPVDLQDPPELIPEFVQLWQSGYEIVAGARKTREESWLMEKTRAIFYKMVQSFSDFDVPEKVGEFQLIDRKVANAVLQYDDKYPFLRGMIASVGFKRVIVPYHWKRREKGKSRLSLFNLLDQALNGFFSFSSLPLRLSIIIGMGISLSCFLYGLFVLFLALSGSVDAPKGVTTLIVGLFFLFGIQLTYFGILGEYVVTIHRQVRGGEVVIEREVVNFSSHE
ncbi:glycosyltransferase family 2 protein [Vibrio bivalvicida]|uniref:Glycosyltransferase family 2 protein n=1 Tax=Vibrio bivalvicida TaxID=1276888 RepID=A0ABV4MGB7_9VIBR